MDCLHPGWIRVEGGSPKDECTAIWDTTPAVAASTAHSPVLSPSSDLAIPWSITRIDPDRDGPASTRHPTHLGRQTWRTRTLAKGGHRALSLDVRPRALLAHPRSAVAFIRSSCLVVGVQHSRSRKGESGQR